MSISGLKYKLSFVFPKNNQYVQIKIKKWTQSYIKNNVKGYIPVKIRAIYDG